jgi:DNA-binding PadR family transcriptional regulator
LRQEKRSPLKVFRGKAGPLNRIIFLVLDSKKRLATYDVFLEVKRTKDWMHVSGKTVYRRMDALEQEGWIAKKGKRPAKPGWPSDLYKLTQKGETSLPLDRDIDGILEKGTSRELQRLAKLLKQIKHE